VNDAGLRTANDPRRVFRLGLLVATLVVLGAIGTQAQTPDRPTITVAATVTAAPGTEAPFPIRVGPPEWIPRESFLKVRGLPPTVSLLDGHSVSPGTWAVALNSLPNLKMLVPSGLTGAADIVVTLVGRDGSILAEAKSTLVVRTSSKPELDSQKYEPALTAQDKQRALGFIKRGDELLATGNVEAARLFYERAAEAGSAQGALALAATYDPDELVRRQVVGGLQPDPVAAQRWYQRAQELGATEAAAPLKRLSGRPR
jgi:hypothetical protein